ncbi:MAG: FxLYD domain-containing protein [Bryobacteraceae bacterium]|nr:FxLYD domain-containing protein [Bryobacteraceae bacterium]
MGPIEVTLKLRRLSRPDQPEAGAAAAETVNKRLRSRRWAVLAALALLLLLPTLFFGRCAVRRLAQPAAGTQAPSTPMRRALLDVTTLTLDRTSGLAVVQGAVRNQSAEPLQYVWVQAAFYDKADRFLAKSVDALIEASTLLPGQTSPFKVYGVWDPAIQTCRLEFTQMARRTLIVRDIRRPGE